jgi:glycosyltransferase involved in cell wall biosynthesis
MTTRGKSLVPIYPGQPWSNLNPRMFRNLLVLNDRRGSTPKHIVANIGAVTSGLTSDQQFEFASNLVDPVASTGLIKPMTTSHVVFPELVRDPLVTIAIPTFNRASWLGDCVRAALAQSYQRFEIIVSDNASTDETASVLDEFTDRRLRVVRQRENIGATPNWNACLAEAKGEYIVFLPDDDRISPWLLERCIALIRTEPQIPMIMALGDGYVAADGRTLPAVASRKLRTGVWDGSDILQEYLKGQISVQGCTTMLRTEALRAGGGFPMGWPFARDLARQLPLLLAGRAGLVNERCGAYCIHKATETSNLAMESHLEDLHKLVDLIIDTADHSIKDLRKRREIELQAGRYLSRHAIGIIASHRRRGAKLAEVLPVIWRRRRDLSQFGMGDAFLLTTPLALLLLVPRPVIRWLRQFKRMLR